LRVSLLNIVSESKSFGGIQSVYSHYSIANQCDMRFAVFIPSQINNQKLACLFWLSGLTCSEQNFITKACAQKTAAELGLVLITPDTSPRNVSIATDHTAQDLGEGASFYVDATQAPWSKHYKMYSYLTEELYALVLNHFKVDEQRVGIFGHSMGGLGALNIALTNQTLYRSLSVFAPVCSPLHSPMGVKAFTHYLGENRQAWEDYNPLTLVKKHGWNGVILMDQGTADPFFEERLQPQLFQEACTSAGVNLNLRLQPGYDHGYYFIASFIEDHLRFHFDNLKG
jgi:S-formylglutathione hydrolase